MKPNRFFHQIIKVGIILLNTSGSIIQTYAQTDPDDNPAPSLIPNISQFNESTGNQIPIGPTFLSSLISRVLPFALIMAGLLLLLMLISGGFTMLTNPTNPQGQDAGKQRITWAIIGFFVLFMAYWLMQILQIVFGIRVVS